MKNRKKLIYKILKNENVSFCLGCLMTLCHRSASLITTTQIYNLGGGAARSSMKTLLCKV